MNCNKCGFPLVKLPEDEKKGQGWWCENKDCELWHREQYDINEIEEEDEENF